MPSIKFVVRKDVIRSDNKANIKIRVSHNKKVRYIASPYYIEPRYMGSDGRIVSRYPGQSALNGALIKLEKEYNDIVADIGTDIYSMDVNSLISKLRAKKKHGSSFTAYMTYRMEQLKKEGRFSYAASYQVTADHLKAFHKADIDFKDITVSFLRDFERHLRLVNKSKVNTCRIYLNNIRAVFYHAVDNDIVKGDITPFRKFKIEQEKTKPRPLDLEDLKTLLKLRPGVTKQQRRALDIFFLIFYTCGTNLKDLLYMKPESVFKGRLEYKRFKTGRSYSIKILPEAREILDRYQGEKYLLCLMDEKEKTSPGRLSEADHDVLSQMNKLLKTIATKYELGFKPTTYSPRYSWATIASKLGVQRDVISHALGHGVSTMTDGYIDYDLAKVDRANRLVVNKLIG
jgi:integrase